MRIGDQLRPMHRLHVALLLAALMASIQGCRADVAPPKAEPRTYRVAMTVETPPELSRDPPLMDEIFFRSALSEDLLRSYAATGSPYPSMRICRSECGADYRVRLTFDSPGVQAYALEYRLSDGSRSVSGRFERSEADLLAMIRLPPYPQSANARFRHLVRMDLQSISHELCAFMGEPVCTPAPADWGERSPPASQPAVDGAAPFRCEPNATLSRRLEDRIALPGGQRIEDGRTEIFLRHGGYTDVHFNLQIPGTYRVCGDQVCVRTQNADEFCRPIEIAADGWGKLDSTRMHFKPIGRREDDGGP